MPDSLVSHHPLPYERRRRFYPADLLPALQRTLSALADIDARYERERDRLAGQAVSPETRHRRSVELHDRHEADREPYVRQLGDLQSRIASLLQGG